jgi:hypothetical protein
MDAQRSGLWTPGVGLDDDYSARVPNEAKLLDWPERRLPDSAATS